jgi:hypothetical protein
VNLNDIQVSEFSLSFPDYRSVLMVGIVHQFIPESYFRRRGEESGIRHFEKQLTLATSFNQDKITLKYQGGIFIIELIKWHRSIPLTEDDIFNAESMDTTNNYLSISLVDNIASITMRRRKRSCKLLYLMAHQVNVLFFQEIHIRLKPGSKHTNE